METLDFGAIWERILPIIKSPGTDVTAALLLLAAAIVVVLVLLFALIIIVDVATSGGQKSRRKDSKELEELRNLLAILEGPQGVAEQAAEDSRHVESVRRSRLITAGLTALVLLITVIALGATTSSAAVCVSCHQGTRHTEAVRAGTADAHAKVECVRCHESSGFLGRVTIEVPGRMAHFVNGARSKPGKTSYGTVVSAPCLSCHSDVKTRVTEDEKRGVKMAHKQPLEAGAQCRDCHTARSGVVSSVTVGMTPCLRCHDGEKQSTECSVCHTKDVGFATRPDFSPAEMVGRNIIETPDCSSCHNMKKSCDPCHGGVKMPHTDLFKAWGHAREGAKDVWFNQGAACSKCHTAQRRPCTKCHSFMPGHPVGAFAESHKKTSGESACSGCHQPKAYTPGRDFCGLCHEKPYITQ